VRAPSPYQQVKQLGWGEGGGYGIRYEELEVLIKSDSTPGLRLRSSHVDALEPQCVLPGRHYGSGKIVVVSVVTI